MTIEDRLSNELSSVADRIEPPGLSVPGLERAGRREQSRRRTAVAGFGAAAAVAVVLAITALPRLGGDAAPGPVDPATPTSSPTGTPRSLDDLPEGAVSAVPFWSKGVLHVGETEISTGLREIQYRGGTTIVGGTADTGTEWDLVDGSNLVPLVQSPGAVQPVVSADGSLVAWTESVSRTLRHVVLWDVATRSEVASLNQPVDVQCCDQGGELTVYGVDLDGRVYFGMGSDVRVWSASSTPSVVTGVPESPYVAQPWPGGLMYQGRGQGLFASPGVFGTVDAGGTFHRVGTTETDQLGRWSPDGASFAYQGDASGSADAKVGLDRVWVQHVEGGAKTELRLPTDRRWDVVAWESGTEVIVETRNDDSDPKQPGLVALVRCDVTTGACERTAQSPEGSVGLPS